MPNLTAEHHIIVVPTDAWERKAKKRDKEERARARRKGWKVKFEHPNKLEWGGYVFEYAFNAIYPHMKPVSKKFGLAKRDFASDKSYLTYDLKCRTNEDYAFDNKFHMYINHSQVEDTTSDIFVVGYYFTKSPHIRFCGWLYKHQVEKRGNKLNKGDKFPSGTGKVYADCWDIPYSEFNAMHLLPE